MWSRLVQCHPHHDRYNEREHKHRHKHSAQMLLYVMYSIITNQEKEEEKAIRCCWMCAHNNLIYRCLYQYISVLYYQQISAVVHCIATIYRIYATITTTVLLLLLFYIMLSLAGLSHCCCCCWCWYYTAVVAEVVVPTVSEFVNYHQPLPSTVLSYCQFCARKSATWVLFCIF